MEVLETFVTHSNYSEGWIYQTVLSDHICLGCLFLFFRTFLLLLLLPYLSYIQLVKIGFVALCCFEKKEKKKQKKTQEHFNHAQVYYWSFALILLWDMTCFMTFNNNKHFLHQKTLKIIQTTLEGRDPLNCDDHSFPLGTGKETEDEDNQKMRGEKSKYRMEGSQRTDIRASLLLAYDLFLHFCSAKCHTNTDSL